MTIRIVVAGATGWTGSALVKGIAASGDLALAGGVARSAAGRDIGEANGLARLGVTIAATLEEALAAPSDVVIDYTSAEAVKAHTLLALRKGATSSSAQPGSRPPTIARSRRRRTRLGAG
ncbi:MAG: hypothetical protein WDM84_10045 [Bauldia sp.]